MARKYSRVSLTLMEMMKSNLIANKYLSKIHAEGSVRVQATGGSPCPKGAYVNRPNKRTTIAQGPRLQMPQEHCTPPVLEEC